MPELAAEPNRIQPAEFAYQYVVLRCVPRVDREEFVNIGVVLYSQFADFLCSASHLDQSRLQAISAELDLQSVASALAAVQSICCGEAAFAAEVLPGLGQRFGWLAAPKSTVVQPGPIHGGLTADPARQLEQLVEVLVH
jgi:hypothetical protein